MSFYIISLLKTLTKLEGITASAFGGCVNNENVIFYRSMSLPGQQYSSQFRFDFQNYIIMFIIFSRVLNLVFVVTGTSRRLESNVHFFSSLVHSIDISCTTHTMRPCITGITTKINAFRSFPEENHSCSGAYSEQYRKCLIKTAPQTCASDYDALLNLEVSLTIVYSSVRCRIGF